MKNWFNGSTGAMLEFVDRAMGPGDNRANSEQWLASTVACHGAGHVAQAFAMLVEKRAAGTMIARPLAHWSNLAKSLKDRAPAEKPQRSEQQSNSVSAILKRRREEAQEVKA